MINENILVSSNISLLQALKKMDEINRRLLIICDELVFKGVISIGDIQRAILNKQDLSSAVINYIRGDILFAKWNDDISSIKKKMREEKIECMPIVDSNHLLVDVIEWEQLFTNSSDFNEQKLNLPVVIMAGGKGSRLLPITNIIPKPLIPISDKTVIEEIMENFIKIGCQNFLFSVNYMAKEIKNYFSKKDKNNYSITYFQEDKPLGTAGSLYLVKDTLKSTFFVSNCDILVDVNLYDLFEYHKKNKNIITVVSVIKNYSIPYGTLETKNNGVLVSLKEKPELVYQINSGLYILEPEVFEYMENNEFLHITDLMSRVIDDGKQVGVFPVSEGSWCDMGNWNEYLQILRKNKYVE